MRASIQLGEHVAAAESAVSAGLAIQAAADAGNNAARNENGEANDSDARLAALRRYNAEMTDAAAMQILNREIASILAGTPELGGESGRQIREAARRIAAGEDADAVMAEIGR